MTFVDRHIPRIVTLGSLALLLGAYGFQYIGKLPPCEMCWWQRYAHMAAIPLGALAIVADRPGKRDWAMVFLLAAGIALVVGAGIAGYHVGIEQKWWVGETTCSNVTLQGTTVQEMLQDLYARPLVRCDEIPWSMFGISMAGYNLILSAALAALAVRGALARRSEP